MKTEMLISAAIMLCAFTIPITCVTSPPAMEASAAQEDTTVAVFPPPVINEAPVVEYSEAIEKHPDCDVVIDSMQDKSSNIDDDMSEIKKDLEELKKRKKIRKVTKKKIKKKKVIDK
jgi:hypothetical protein